MENTQFKIKMWEVLLNAAAKVIKVKKKLKAGIDKYQEEFLSHSQVEKSKKLSEEKEFTVSEDIPDYIYTI